MRIVIAIVLALVAMPALAHTLDPTRLPLGDGHLSKAPKVGYIWACHVSPMAGGAFRDGPWIDKADGTYDLTAKAVVDGAVTWPHRFSMKVSGASRVFSWNDLPDHPTGIFPISRKDDAYQTDRNPNHIAAQSMKVALPAAPALAARPTCAPGAVGILLSGVVLFNALDAPGRDAVAHETQDSCQGHPQESSVYHYHNVSKCVLAEYDSKSGPSKLLGYAIDGFGIYGPRDASGKVLTSADLDACHGITGPVEWEGRRVTMYHYVATLDFPYTIGCLRGSWSQKTVRAISGPPPRGGRRGPPGGGPPGRPPRLR